MLSSPDSYFPEGRPAAAASPGHRQQGPAAARAPQGPAWLKQPQHQALLWGWGKHRDQHCYGIAHKGS